MIEGIYILGKKGIACSNDAELDVHHEINRTPEGKQVVRRFNVVVVDGVFLRAGTIAINDDVELIGKMDIGAKIAYKGHVTGVSSTKAKIRITDTNGNYNNILQTIKKRLKDGNSTSR